jgi:hypothetical protein
MLYVLVRVGIVDIDDSDQLLLHDNYNPQLWIKIFFTSCQATNID